MPQAHSFRPATEQSAVQLDARRRASLPAGLLKRLPNYRQADQHEFLFALTEPGRIEVYDWEKFSDSVVKIGDELRSSAEFGDTSAWERLAVFEDRYRRQSIGSDHRISFSGDLLLHLGVATEPRPWLYVRAFQNHVEIWSPAYRDHQLQSARFDDLP